MKKLLLTSALCAMTAVGLAQSGTNSPYSQFGLGKLSDRSQGFSRAMNGVGIGFRDAAQVNTLNPASYSSVDSLTFLFDIGMTLQTTHFKENDLSKNAKNADVDYAVASFRLIKNLGFTFGILPYTNIGYDYSTTSVVDGYTIPSTTSEDITNTQSYSGEGGIREVFIGLGWQTPIKGLSIGANIGYVWGDIDNYITNSYSDSYVKSLAKQYTADISSYKLNLGMQYSVRLSKLDYATIGVTYTPGHNLSSDASCQVITSNSQSSVNDTTTFVAADAYSIPTEIGIGLAWRRSTRWLVGLDYTLQKWSSASMPVYSETDNVASYTTNTNVFSDRHKINLGGQYCKDSNGRHLIDRLKYRFGVGYTSSYIKVGNTDGPKELSMSCGIGIPIINAYNNRSILNLGFQWQNLHAKNMLSENTFLFNIGITFNERWFAKWRFE